MTAGLHLPTRMRRTRATGWSRALHGETVLTPADLIWPLFITAGDTEEPIATLPGVSRWPVKDIAKRAKEARDLGIPCVALFPNTPRDLRTDDGREALNPDNLMCRATKAIKDAVPDIGVLTDVALDPYTAHGHDGLIDTKGYVLNDATVEVLVGQSLNQAHAGADIIAPSDMMDGRIGAIRTALEDAMLPNVQIMSYAAKYASAFYGPFRDAVGASGALRGDKKTYQMNPANRREALREAALDAAEGADLLMVKPAGAYLDIIRDLRESTDLPLAAYQVSGEYAQLQAAAEKGWLDLRSARDESLLAIRRAGADVILTYFAEAYARDYASRA